LTDQTITCRDCGEAFTFTAGEQAFYQERGYSEPQRCANCRAERKAQRAASGYDSGSSSSSYSRGGGGGYSSGGYSGGGGYSSGGGGGYSSGPRQMYPAVCSACGKETEVPFQPRNDKPVYCRECFRGQIVLEIVEREPIRPPKGSAMIQTPQIGDSIDQYFAPSTSGHCWTILR
jgi:CxxC-x17-CxxC domain-containing protein